MCARKKSATMSGGLFVSARHSPHKRGGKMKGIPDTLFRYYPPNGRAVANLCGRILYFNSPKNFNDIYDGRVVLCTKRFAEKYGAAAAADVEGKAWDGLRGRVGVVCFTEHENDLRMWSHYGDCSREFCLGFNTLNEELFGEGRIKPVKYDLPGPPAVDALDLYEGGLDAPLIERLYYKPREWESEKEWRLVAQIDGEFVFPPSMLKHVYFGGAATMETKMRLYAIVREKYPHAKIYEMHPSKAEYKMIPKEFNPRGA